MNGEATRVHGPPVLNGAPQIKALSPGDTKSIKTPGGATSPAVKDVLNSVAHTNGTGYDIPNGVSTHKRDYQAAPEEVLHLVDDAHYLPMATIVGRSAQNCWNSLYDLVDQLSAISIPAQSADPGRPQSIIQHTNNQTKLNLEKKDRILNFAADQKAIFVKLLVLLQWSKNVRDVSKTISLNFWFHEQRSAYDQVCAQLFEVKAKAAAWQTPNPDIRTAGEILSLQRAPSVSDLGYHEPRKLSKAQMVSTLHRLNNVLTARLALEDDLPIHMRKYRIHDGRATFEVQDEFEVDISVLEESPESPWRVVDFRFLSNPRPRISVAMRTEMEGRIDVALAGHKYGNGLRECYEFLHEVNLSNRLSEMHRQALELARKQWSGNLRVELQRRNLILQYWTERRGPKSWIEIGAHGPQASMDSSTQLTSSQLGYRWYRHGIRVDDFAIQTSPSVLSINSILNQIVAQHISYTLDAIFVRLESSPLFSSTNLILEDAISDELPEQCHLRIGTTEDTSVTVNISAVDGLVVISPVSELANRFQFDLNRSKNLAEDFASRFSHFRCAVADASVHKGFASTPWQSLATFTPTLTETRSLLGSAVSRASYFSHPLWSKKYLLAAAYKSTGDTMSILDLSSSEKFAGATVVHTQPLQPQGRSPMAYFTKLSDTACGIVAIHHVARGIKQGHSTLHIPAMQGRDMGSPLPGLTFRLDLPGFANDSPEGTTARLRYAGIDPSTQRVRLVVQVKCDAASSVIERLTQSSPDSDIEFLPQKQQVSLHLSLVNAEIQYDNVLQRIQQLCDVVAAVQLLENTPSVKVAQVSLTAMQISYQFDGGEEWTIDLRMPTAACAAKVSFLPEKNNPSACLSTTMSELLNDTTTAFASRLRSMITTLSVMSPLMTKVRELQQAVLQQQSEDSSKEQLRLHVLVRQPSMLALQYYMAVGKKSDANPEPTATSRLLARFEVLPLEAEKSMFVLRSALEELRSYERSSYMSSGVRDKVKQGLFQNSGEKKPGWLCYDNAAGFLAQQPQQVLDTLHRIMVECAKSPDIQATNNTKSEAAPQKEQQAQASTNGAAATGPQKPPQAVPKIPAPQQNKAKAPVNKTGNKIPPGKEVITLDD